MNNTIIKYNNALVTLGYTNEQIQLIWAKAKDMAFDFKGKVEQSSPEYKKAVAMALSSGATAVMTQVTGLVNQANENYAACREDETCDFALKGVGVSFAALAVATIAYKSINGLLSKKAVDQAIEEVSEVLMIEDTPVVKSDDSLEGVAALFNTDKFDLDARIADVARLFEAQEVTADNLEGVATLFNTDKFDLDSRIADSAKLFEEKEVIAPVIFSAVEAPKAPVVDEAANVAAFRKAFGY